MPIRKTGKYRHLLRREASSDVTEWHTQATETAQRVTVSPRTMGAGMTPVPPTRSLRPRRLGVEVHDRCGGMFWDSRTQIWFVRRPVAAIASF